MKRSSTIHPALTACYKGIYPFKLGTTSFIYPDDYVPNVKLLGPFVDEIELLLFESGTAEALFAKPVLDELLQLGRELNLTYNLHLPIDMAISAPDPIQQQFAVDTVIRIIHQLDPLAPSSCTLHIPCTEPNAFDDHAVNAWRDMVYKNLRKIIDGGIPGHALAVETLDYPFEILDDILSDLNLSVCLDVGHVIRYRYDLWTIFSKYCERISIMHLHGVADGQDHLPLEHLPVEFHDPLMRILTRFRGTVSLEVFSYPELSASLNTLRTLWQCR